MQTETDAFGTWMLKQPDARGALGELIAAAAKDRAFPRNGSADDVRRYLSESMAPGEMIDAVDDAEADWRNLQ
ncbi:hypothetical protein [Sphingomonas sp. T9W2]|uniref:hypothetical protein n=1 Tax=Sphingomonas sp. T9W2 TaxID=3143183 RepID=UPI0031F4ED38